MNTHAFPVPAKHATALYLAVILSAAKDLIVLGQPVTLRSFVPLRFTQDDWKEKDAPLRMTAIS
jgi:hypothetical protein